MHVLPELFQERMKAFLGEEEYQAYIESYEQERVYGLRVNTMKISPEAFKGISPFELKEVPWTHNGFYYSGKEKPGKHPLYFGGVYYLQEPSAMTPAELLPVEEGDRVLDVCAAPGGKSTELAAKLNGSGLLVSNDISASRAQALLKNLELFGVKNSLILSEDPRKLTERFSGFFDKILIDAPCSGEGMFRKEPAVIKSWVEHGNDFYVSLQKQITEAALKMLKPGGLLLYSTCTFSPLEDENIILYMKSLCPELQVLPIIDRYEGFLPGRPDAAEINDPDLLNCIRIYPHHVQGEGHFAALLKKGGGLTGEVSFGKEKSGKTVKIPQEAEEFMKLIDSSFFTGSLELRNDKLSMIPDPSLPLQGLHILRNGLFMGECRKNRFEPSQALAMALKKDQFENCIDLPVEDDRVIRYLKGETIDISDFTVDDGFALVCVQGFPLGFGKASGGKLKNRYLKGWRYQ